MTHAQAGEIFHVIQTVDSAKLARRLNEVGAPLDVMIEVKLSDEAAKYGCAPAERGMVTGSRPEGLTSPESTRAIALPPSSPGKNDCSTAAQFSSAQSIT